MDKLASITHEHKTFLKVSKILFRIRIIELKISSKYKKIYEEDILLILLSEVMVYIEVKDIV